MSLTLGHVILVALTTAVGASLGRFIRQRSRRLRFLSERARAGLFLLGITLAVVLVAASHASGIEKAGLVGFYIGAVYGLVASEPSRRRAPGPDAPGAPDETATRADAGARPRDRKTSQRGGTRGGA